MKSRMALGLGALFLFATAATGVAHAATTVTKESFSGSQGATGFFISQTITCAGGAQGSVTGFGFLSGADQIFTVVGTPKMNGNGIFVEIDSYSNSCTGTNFSFAEGAISNGYVPPDKQLTSAQLIGSGNVQDFDSGRTILVSLNLTLTGVGPISSSISSSISRVVATHSAPLNMSVTHSANTNRAGTTAGSVSIEGFSVTPIFFFTDLITNDNSQVIIQR